MRISENEWRRLATQTREAIDCFIAALSKGNLGNLRLAHLVQAASLNLAFRVFVKGAKPSNGSHTDLLTITEAINNIWIRSKEPGNHVNYAEYHRLHDVLRTIVVDSDPLDRCENPLNWILPSFETLWRIVLRTLIEVKLKSHDKHPEWTLALIAFACEPTKGNFEARFPSTLQGQVTDTNYISVENIVLEALRLYPPTCHVKRAFKFGETDPVQVFDADIERIQVDKEIWGANALNFVPQRWARLTESQKKAFMPFGNQPFACPARQVFGPWAIGLLVGMLIVALGDKGYFTLVSFDERTVRDLDSGSRLALGKNNYIDLELKKPQ